MTLQINHKFRDILPVLAPEEYSQLEESILKEGCHTALMVWNNQIIDGHNRHSICTKHDLPFAAIDRTFDFETEDDVLEWIFTNQLGRRNLTANQKTYFIGELYELRKRKHGGDRKSDDYEKSSSQNVHLKNNVATVTTLNSEENNKDSEDDSIIEASELAYEIEPQFQPKTPKRTINEVAKQFNVSPKTVQRAAEVKKAIDVLPIEEKTNFLAGKTTQKEVIEKAQSLSPEMVDALRKKQEIKTDAAAKWGSATYKIYLQITSINDVGGIEKLTQNWNSERKIYWRDELRRLEQVFSKFADELEETING